MKKMYRIELKVSDTIFTDLIMMAAISNGGKYTPLSKIADAADWLCTKYPTTGEMHTVNRIDEHTLSIDKGMENILFIEEVEIQELNTREEISSQEARDILDELAPTLHRQGIDNPDFHENLN